MANGTTGRGLCQAPFLQLSEFPYTGGCKLWPDARVSLVLTGLYTVEYGRLCAPVPTLAGPIDCCLPCPVTDWVYPDSMAISTQPVRHRKLTISPRFLYPFENCELAQCRRHRPVYYTPPILYCPSNTKDTSTLPYDMFGPGRHGDGGKSLLMDCLESMSSSL